MKPAKLEILPVFKASKSKKEAKTIFKALNRAWNNAVYYPEDERAVILRFRNLAAAAINEDPIVLDED